MKKIGLAILSILSLLISGCSLLPSTNFPNQQNSGNGSENEEVSCRFTGNYNGENYHVGETITLTYSCTVNGKRATADYSASSNLSFIRLTTNSLVFSAIDTGIATVDLKYNDKVYDSVSFSIKQNTPTQTTYSVSIDNKDYLVQSWSYGDPSRTISLSIYKNGISQHVPSAFYNGELTYYIENTNVLGFDYSTMTLWTVNPGITTIYFTYHDSTDSVTIQINDSSHGEHGRSSEDPLTVSEASQICAMYGDTSTNDYYYIKGYVTGITTPYSLTANNMTFTICERSGYGGPQIQCYLIDPMYKSDLVYANTYVVIYASLRMQNGLYSTERGGRIEFIEPTYYPSLIQSTSLSAALVCSNLVIGEMSRERYEVTGYISEKATVYDCYLTDSNDQFEHDDDNLYVCGNRSIFRDFFRGCSVGTKIRVIGFLKRYQDNSGQIFNQLFALTDAQLANDDGVSVSVDGVNYLMNRDDTSEPNLEAQYSMSIALNAGQYISFFYNGQRLSVYIDSDANNNVKTMMSGVDADSYFTVRQSSDSARIYLKHYYDGSYVVWVSGYDASSTQNVVYMYIENGASTELTRMNIGMEGDGISAIYGGSMPLTAGQKVYFTINATEVSVYADGEGNNAYPSNGMSPDNRMTIVSTVALANIYLEVHTDGTYHIFISGYEAPTPAMRIKIDSGIYTMDKVGDADPSTGKISTYHYYGDLTAGSNIRFIDNNDNALIVTPYTDNNNLECVSGVESSTDVVVRTSVTGGEIWIDVFENGTYKVYASGYQAPTQSVVFYRNGMAYATELNTSPKDPNAEYGYYCLADVGPGDMLYFMMGDEYLTFRTEGYNNVACFSSSNIEGTTGTVNCYVENADVYLYYYTDGYYNLVIDGPNNRSIQFGSYPQSLVTDQTTIDGLEALDETSSKDAYGFYILGNEKYAKITANCSVSFPNGTQKQDGETCWFKCEPITWTIIKSSNGQYTLLADKLLDVSVYATAGAPENSYINSTVRNWLNSTFYTLAFRDEDKSKIMTTNVDNSPSTTNDSSSPYYCDTTNDFVYLPSYQDMINQYYYFYSQTNNSDTRYGYFTDYAMLQKNTQGAPNIGSYWTRSPYAYASDCVNIVGDSGEMTNCMAGSTLFVRPMITVMGV